MHSHVSGIGGCCSGLVSCSLTNGGKVCGDHAKGNTCFLAEEELVRGVGHIGDLASFSQLAFPENRSMAAPRIVIPLLLAACIFIMTGMRSSLFRPSLLMTLMLARQLWQPVSAMAKDWVGLGVGVRVRPKCS